MREQLDASSYMGPATFGMRPLLTEPEQLDEWQPDVAIVGAPWDDNTTNRPGARFGPRALRANAYDPGTYHLDLGVEIFDHLEVVDYGDAIVTHGHVGAVAGAPSTSACAEVASRGIIPVILGGDHSITWPAATAVAEHHGFGNVGMIHFDAHADTADSIDGNLRQPRHARCAGSSSPARSRATTSSRSACAATGRGEEDQKWMRDNGLTLAPDAGDLGARRQGRDGGCRSPRPLDGTDAHLPLYRHRRARPGVRPRDRNPGAGRIRPDRPAAGGAPDRARHRRRRDGRDGGRTRLRPRGYHGEQRPPASSGRRSAPWPTRTSTAPPCSGSLRQAPGVSTSSTRSVVVCGIRSPCGCRRRTA